MKNNQSQVVLENPQDYSKKELIEAYIKLREIANSKLKLGGRSSSSKSVLIGSDWHVGSKVAICSDSPEIIDGEPYTPNKAQKALYQCLQIAVDEVEQKPNVFVVNGEPIDGANRSSMGQGVWSTNLTDQTRDFKKLMKLIPTWKKLIFVRGSGYHVDTGGATNLEEIVAEEMKADRYRAYAGSGFTDYECNLEVNDKNFNFTHHIGFAQWEAYRTTAMARELVKMHFEHGRRGFHTDVVVRSHVHYYVEARFKNILGFTTPAWKFPDGFMYRRGIPTLPDVGLMEVIVETNGKILVIPHIVEVNFKPRRMHID